MSDADDEGGSSASEESDDDNNSSSSDGDAPCLPPPRKKLKKVGVFVVMLSHVVDRRSDNPVTRITRSSNIGLSTDRLNSKIVRKIEKAYQKPPKDFTARERSYVENLCWRAEVIIGPLYGSDVRRCQDEIKSAPGGKTLRGLRAKVVHAIKTAARLFPEVEISISCRGAFANQVCKEQRNKHVY